MSWAQTLAGLLIHRQQCFAGMTLATPWSTHQYLGDMVCRPIGQTPPTWRALHASSALSSTTSESAPSTSTSSEPGPSGAASTDSSAPAATGGANMAFGTRQVVARGQRAAGPKHGVVHINNTMNNIIMVLTDAGGRVKALRSAGCVGFRNARKSQPVAAEKTAEALAAAALRLGYGSVVVKMKGVGQHKQLATQMLHAAGLRITELQDITPVPYNGCRLPKRRRV